MRRDIPPQKGPYRLHRRYWAPEWFSIDDGYHLANWRVHDIIRIVDDKSKALRIVKSWLEHPHTYEVVVTHGWYQQSWAGKSYDHRPNS